MTQANTFPRRVFLIRTRAIEQAILKISPQFRSSSDRSGSGGPKRHDRSTAHVVAWFERRKIQETTSRISPPLPGFTAFNPGYKIFSTRLRQQRRQNAERRCSLTAASLDAARGLQSALASRRSTAALVGRLSPPNSAPGHASWGHFCLLLGGSGTILWTAFRRRSRHLSTGVIRARLSQSRVSTPAPVVMPEG
jgi:hypothetical protein